jgi:hypothetical protein
VDGTRAAARALVVFTDGASRRLRRQVAIGRAGRDRHVKPTRLNRITVSIASTLISDSRYTAKNVPGQHCGFERDGEIVSADAVSMEDQVFLVVHPTVNGGKREHPRFFIIGDGRTYDA